MSIQGKNKYWLKVIRDLEVSKNKPQMFGYFKKESFGLLHIFKNNFIILKDSRIQTLITWTRILNYPAHTGSVAVIQRIHQQAWGQTAECSVCVYHFPSSNYIHHFSSTVLLLFAFIFWFVQWSYFLPLSQRCVSTSKIWVNVQTIKY